jgi:hypothetical protein
MTKATTREGFAAKALRANLKRQGRGPTLLEHAVMTVGIWQGGEVLWNLAMWTMARRKFGQEPTWQQFGEVALVQRAMAYKALKGLSEVYGEGLAAAADAVEAQSGKDLDRLIQLGAGRDKDTGAVVGLVGALAAPAGMRL